MTIMNNEWLLTVWIIGFECCKNTVLGADIYNWGIFVAYFQFRIKWDLYINDIKYDTKYETKYTHTSHGTCLVDY